MSRKQRQACSCPDPDGNYGERVYEIVCPVHRWAVTALLQPKGPLNLRFERGPGCRSITNDRLRVLAR